MKKFLRHHVHSIMSTRDGMLPIETILDEAEKAGEATSITDHGSIAAWPQIYNYCKQNKIKPIFGAEFYINKHLDRLLEVIKLIKQEKNADVKRQLSIERDAIKKYNHLILIAKNQEGFHNLIKLANIAYTKGFYGKPTISYDELFKYKQGIIISTACLGSTVCQEILKNEIKNAKEHTELMKQEFGDDLYLEVQINGMEDQKKCNKYLLALAKKLDIKVCVGIDSHYLNNIWGDTHQDLLLLQSKNKREDVGKKDWKVTYETKNGEIKTKKFALDKEFRKGLKGEDLEEGQKVGTDIILKVEQVSRVWEFEANVPLMSEADVREQAKTAHPELKKFIDEIVASNYEIYEKILPITMDESIKLPKIDDADKKLTELVKTKLKEKKLVNKDYVDRVKHELKVIKENNFSTYFLILYDFIDWAYKHEIPLGAGRGSGVSSLVGYCLGIHRINPLEERWNNLPFERFLAAERNIDKIIIEDDEGYILEYLETDELVVNRNGTKIIVSANELQELDSLVI